MFAAQFGHRFPGCVVQVLRAFVVHCNREDHAILDGIQISDEANAFTFELIGVKSEEMHKKNVTSRRVRASFL